MGYYGAMFHLTLDLRHLLLNLKKSLTDNNLDYNRLKDPDYVTAHIRNLRRIYQNLGKKPTRGTAINLNSMLVMSYPMNQDNCVCFRPRGMFRCSCDCLLSRWGDGYAGSCLYTGDTSANDSEVWQTIEQIITRCFRHDKKLVMLQVPHHGSKNSYDQKLVGSDKFLHGFANYDPYYRQHIFDDDLPMKFAAKGKRLVLVTREYASLFEAYYVLC